MKFLCKIGCYLKDYWILLFLLGVILVAGYFSWELVVYVKESFGTFFPSGTDRGDWGTLGDLFGGILNPFFSLLGLVMLLVTLFQNQRELSLSRREFKESKKALQSQAITQEKQRFEGTFFSLLEQHNLALEKITNHPASSFDGNQNETKNLANILKVRLIGGGTTVSLFEFIDGIEESRENLFKYDNQVNQYFRILYQILRFIASNCPNSTVNNSYTVNSLLTTECSPDEKIYSNIVRSFLSEDIYILLSINCLCDNDESDSFYKYKLLVERYSLLEHMPLSPKSNMNNDLLMEIISGYKQKAFGDNVNYISL